MKKFISHLLIVLLIGGLIYLLASISNPYDLMPDKLYYRLKTDELFGTRIIYIVEGMLHFCLFGLLAAFIAKALIGNRKLKVILLVLALIIASAFGWMVEVHQMTVPHRAFEGIDFTIDVLGALTGVVLFSRWHKKHLPALKEQ